MVIGVPQYGSGQGVEVDPRTLRPIEPDRPHVRWVMVNESDVPAARGPN